MNYLTEEIIYIYNIYGSGEWPAKILKEAHNACKSSFHWHGFLWYTTRNIIIRVSRQPNIMYVLSPNIIKKCEANIILSNPPYLVKLYKKGMSYNQIARMLCVSNTIVRKIIQDEMEKSNNEITTVIKGVV